MCQSKMQGRLGGGVGGGVSNEDAANMDKIKPLSHSPIHQRLRSLV